MCGMREGTKVTVLHVAVQLSQHHLPKILFFFFVILPFLGPLLQHVEVPRLGVELELQPPAYNTAPATRDLNHVCDLHHSSQQRRILNPLIEARDRTHNLMIPNQIR